MTKTCYCTLLFVGLLIKPTSGHSLLEDAEYFSTAVCESLENVNQKIQFQNDFEKQKFFAYRNEVQTFLKNAPAYLQEKQQANDLASIAIACAIVDDATNAFTKACVTDEGVSIDISAVKGVCEHLSW